MDEQPKEKASRLKLFAQVAHFLGQGWRLDQRENNNGFDSFILFNPDEREKILASFGCYGSERNRIIIRGISPNKSLISLCDNPRITVAQDRQAMAIASEIKRRVLPGYRLALDKARKHYQSDLKLKEQEKHIKELFTSVGLLDYRRDRSTNYQYFFGRSSTVSGSIRFWRKEMSVSLNFPNIDKAIKFAHLLKMLMEE